MTAILYPRVSEVLCKWVDYSHINPEVLLKKAELGTEVHFCIDFYLDGVPFYPTEKAKGYMESFTTWLEDQDLQYITKEERFNDSDLKLSGQVDGIVLYPSTGDLVLIDYKTSASVNSLAWEMQGGFYYMLAKKRYPELSKRYLFINLNKDGKKPKIIEFTFTDEVAYLCKAALDLFHRFNKKAPAETEAK